MLLITIGTQPELIKIKPLLGKMTLPHRVVCTGQHNLDFSCDYKIKIPKNKNRLNAIVASILNFDYTEEYVLVCGDTTSCLGFALSANNQNKKLIQLESGLRTYTKQPHPEESNRRIIDVLADIHFCPTELNRTQLKKENIGGKSFVVGNTLIDTLSNHNHSCYYGNKILITMHRRENWTNILDWFLTFEKLANIYTQYSFLLLLNNNPIIKQYGNTLHTVKIIPPLRHEDFLTLLAQCRMVITDSGGLQEECSFFNKKCLVCRQNTERVEVLGKSSFITATPAVLIASFEYHIQEPKITFICPYGDGKASDRVLNILQDEMGVKPKCKK